MSGLPGYTGYIPGKVAENIHGATFQVANESASGTIDMNRSGVLPPRIRRAPGPAPGHDVPGYMGFCPGRYADNVIGQTQAKGSENAAFVKDHQKAERHARVACYRRGERPPTGAMDYSGYRTQGALPGVDTMHSVYE